LYGKFEDISFDLHDGEILAIGGLSDAGIHELGKVIAGAVPASQGTVRDVKTNRLIKHPVHALKSGMAYVPKDRDNEALMMGANIKSNLCLPSINDLANKLGLIRPMKIRQLSYSASKKFNVRCLGIDQPISALSGGNKQKISIGRWLIKNLNVIVMDCPTRGVDVSVKAYIYNLMKELKEQGIAMILIADEMAEAIGMADRLLILKNGKLSSIMNRNEDMTQAKVIEVMI
jgi:ribose transport system ATP-binding protein